MSINKRGRPSGLTINPAAFAQLLGEESQAAFARRSHVSASYLSEMLSGDKGAVRDVADRIAKALEVEAAVLFPELVSFRVHVRQFTAERLVDAS